MAIDATDGAFGLSQNGSIRLFFNRDSVGNLAARFILYIADSTYAKRKLGRYDFDDFTGLALVFKPDGNIKDTLMCINGRVVGKPSISLVTSSQMAGFSYRCRSDEYQKTYQIEVPCPAGCGCIPPCYRDVTDCVGGGANYVQPGLVQTLFGNLPSLPTYGGGGLNGGGGRNNGGGVTLTSDEDYAKYYLFNVAHLSQVTIRRLAQNFPDEFLSLGFLVASDGSASAEFARLYATHLLAGRFPRFSDASDLRELYNLTFGMPNLEGNFDAVAKYLIDNNFSNESADAVKEHVKLLGNDNYLEANINEGNPLLGSIRYKNVVKSFIAPSIENELRQLAANNSNLSSPGFDVFKNIIIKVIKKKAPGCIPGLSTLADLTEAYAAYQIGDYRTAALSIASAIVDLIPPAKLLKLAVNAADIFLTVQRIAEPIIKLYNHFGSRFSHVFEGFFSTFDNLGLIDKLEISTSGNSVVNIDVFLDSSVTVDDFLNYFSGFVGAWQSYGGGKLRIDLGGGNDLFFYPRSTSGDVPSIQITIDGVKVKMRFK